MNETVGSKGAYQILNKIMQNQRIVSTEDMLPLIDESGLARDSFSDLVDKGLLIGTTKGYYISSIGERVTLLLRAINGDTDISDIFRKLSDIYPWLKPYELLTEDITGYFINSLMLRPNFITLYICSPWIRLEQDQLDMFEKAVLKAKRQYPNLQILVITLPRVGYRNWEASIDTFELLKELGAEIVTKWRLHAKLYISEPGPFGGAHYAIIGSENLTGRKNIELSIRIANDNEMLSGLANYFRDIHNESDLLEEVKDV